MNTLRDSVTHWARLQPHAPLLIAPETGHSISYGDFALQTRRLAGLLAGLGIQKGAHIGLYLQNGLQTSRLFLSVMAAGYVVTPFNLLAHEDQLAWVLHHSDCVLLFHGADQREMLLKVRPKLHRELRCIEVDSDAVHLGLSEIPQPEIDLGPVSPSDPALLMYTSGTTGMPKGVRLTHANVLHAAQTVSAWHQLTPRDRVLSSLPIYHINGQCIATITPFFSGGSIVAAQKFSASQWWDWVLQHECSWINLVPTIIAYLLNSSERSPVQPQDLRRVRFARSASAPLPPEHHKAFEKRFGVTVIEAMGMTESASVVFCNPHDERRRYGSPGLPCGVTAKIVDAEGQEVADGITGEICFSGANVMSGYYHADDETRKAFDPRGWLKTGDLGHRDSDGFYFVTGRLKELIIKGGENIAPREIDEILLQHPAVLDAACAGIPDENYGQDIMACLILKEGSTCSEEEIRTFCFEKLGKFKSPKVVRFVEQLPRGPSGKVQRLKLAGWS
jgi:acyl-CoA synthetase (AMP-forming)/AMP-acid ligase II